MFDDFVCAVFRMNPWAEVFSLPLYFFKKRAFKFGKMLKILVFLI